MQEFAREHGVDPATTYQVLAGRKKGKRGEAHKVAVLLGMKDGIIPSRDAVLEAEQRDVFN